MDQTNINIRKGLPEELQSLAKVYPREIWQNHHNFNELTRFWLSRHAMFREIISRLKNDTSLILESGPDASATQTFKSTTSRFTDFLLSQLHEHHTIEDHHYFPMLKPFNANLEKGFELMEADHHELDHNIHLLSQQTRDLLSAIASGKEVLKHADQTLVIQTRFENFLDRHLCDEEELIVPIILEYGGVEIG